ncbi:hypothetical protein EVAR_30349_1 [Eumeta japonica]|uniref:Uncharacterized protein n=1 Tax=Eumeta variegata TaxID=151549 RepID=A0A4C2A5Y7_EUMVA|nr:hypothetical protein EVAR_30349_1 [Eumeta japonica]
MSNIPTMSYHYLRMLIQIDFPFNIRTGFASCDCLIKEVYFVLTGGAGGCTTGGRRRLQPGAAVALAACFATATAPPGYFLVKKEKFFV